MRSMHANKLGRVFGPKTFPTSDFYQRHRHSNDDMLPKGYLHPAKMSRVNRENGHGPDLKVAFSRFRAPRYRGKVRNFTVP